MPNKKQTLELLEQIIEKARQEDLNEKRRLAREGKAEQGVGKSWMVFHLEALKGLISDEDEWYNM
jgi:restriction endonuclease S subunit|tara:strand:- start:7193 stop:7387 length:195 start_codon:yes stop_codon:yes gene_type:complete